MSFLRHLDVLSALYMMHLFRSEWIAAIHHISTVE